MRTTVVWREVEPAVVVSLDDAPLPASGVAPGYTADDYVVHEQDLHAAQKTVPAYEGPLEMRYAQGVG